MLLSENTPAFFLKSRCNLTSPLPKKAVAFVKLEQVCQTTNFLATKDVNPEEISSLPRSIEMQSQNDNIENDTPFFSPQNHSLNVGIAMVCKSTDAALIFNHVFFWLQQNKANGRNQIGGRTWMYETIPNIQNHFPYLSEMQVKRALGILVEKGYLIRENHNDNKFDKTNWYAVFQEDWLEIQKMFSKGRQRPLEESPAPVPSVEFDRSYKDKDHNTDIKTDKGGGPSPSAFVKKKKEPVEMLTFGTYVQLKEGEYEKLCKEIGKDFVDYYIQAIDNHMPNAPKQYKDYAAAVRQWHLRDRSKNSLPDVKKVQETAVPPSPDRLIANRKLCEIAESKLRDKFTSTILFQAGPTKAQLFNQHKDFKREYDYDKIDTKQLKEMLLKDLERCFPGATDILMGTTNQKITNIIGNLSEQYKMSGTP